MPESTVADPTVPEGAAEGEQMTVTGDSGSGGADRTARAAGQRRVRDRDVVLLAALCVAVVLGLQFLGIVFPPFADAIGRPPTVIVALIVVTLVVLGRALWTSVRRG